MGGVTSGDEGGEKAPSYWKTGLTTSTSLVVSWPIWCRRQASPLSTLPTSSTFLQRPWAVSSRCSSRFWRCWLEQATDKTGRLVNHAEKASMKHTTLLTVQVHPNVLNDPDFDPTDMDQGNRDGRWGWWWREGGVCPIHEMAQFYPRQSTVLSRVKHDSIHDRAQFYPG